MPNKYIAPHIAALHGYTPGEQPKRRVIKLNTNENPYPPTPRVKEAIASFAADILRLYPDPNSDALRDRIAEIFGCKRGNVFVGNGSDEVLANVTRTFVPDGGLIGWFEPSYSLYPVLDKIRNARAEVLPLADDFSFVPQKSESDLFYLANPNAPTGLQTPVEEVARFAKNVRGVLLVDEAYADFADDNCMRLAVAPENENIIVSRTFSKSFSLAGLRFGYAIGPEALIDAMNVVRDSYNLNALTQRIALAALSDLDYMKSNVERVRATRERLAAELSRRKWHVIPSSTNFIFAEPPQGAEKLFKALKERDIFVRYFPLPRISNYLRISVGTDAEIDKLLSELETL